MKNASAIINDTTYTIHSDEKGILTLVPNPKKKIEKRADYVAAGYELRRIRKEEGKSAQWLADKMRICTGYLGRMECGYDFPIRRYKQAYKILGREFVMTFMEA